MKPAAYDEDNPSEQNIRSATSRYNKLLDEIKLHNHLYYKEGKPSISDFEYDCLKAEAERLENFLKKHISIDKLPTIGDDRSSGFKSFEHFSKMLSLSNTYSREELFQFDERTRSHLGQRNFSYVVEPKIDGIAINLIYKNGNLYKALTRGNGTMGDDVTQNVKKINHLPMTIANTSDVIEIRGEIYMDDATFTIINNSREDDGLELFANPRNLVAGTIKTLDPKEVAERDLKLITYSIGYSTDGIPFSQIEVLEYLRDLGFKSQEKYWAANDIGEAWSSIEKLDKLRNEISYHTDGAVVKVNELQLYNILGETAKSPRWAIAYKFAPERAKTKILNIALQVGRTGVVTPVAEFEPVQLSGSTISRATLHNADEIMRKDVRIGDTVTIEKAGEIIPAIVSVDTNVRDEKSAPFSFPTKCPACGSPLTRLPGEVAWRCQNSCCGPQIRRIIKHFVSKSAMDIDGIGESVIDKLVTARKLRDVSDLYALKLQDLSEIERFGTKSALKVIENIENSKNNPFWRLLHGIGISGIGSQTAKDIAKVFISIDDLKNASQEQLENIDGIGNTVSSSIISFFANPDNVQILEKLKKYGVNCKSQNETKRTDNDFYGKTFVLTGTLRGMSRNEAINAIENFGGKISNSVSKKNTDVVIFGENSGSKLERAKVLNIQIWDENKLTTALHNASTR